MKCNQHRNKQKQLLREDNSVWTSFILTQGEHRRTDIFQWSEPMAAQETKLLSCTMEVTNTQCNTWLFLLNFFVHFLGYSWYIPFTFQFGLLTLSSLITCESVLFASSFSLPYQNLVLVLTSQGGTATHETNSEKYRLRR